MSILAFICISSEVIVPLSSLSSLLQLKKVIAKANPKINWVVFIFNIFLWFVGKTVMNQKGLIENYFF